MTFDEWFSDWTKDTPSWRTAKMVREGFRFVWNAATAIEREACAKACEALQVNKSPDYYPGQAFDGACRTCADEIRKRSNVGIQRLRSSPLE